MKEDKKHGSNNNRNNSSRNNNGGNKSGRNSSSVDRMRKDEGRGRDIRDKRYHRGRKKKKKKAGIFSTIILVVALAVFCFSAFQLFKILKAEANMTKSGSLRWKKRRAKRKISSASILTS